MVTDWSHDGTRLTYADPMDGAVQQVRVLDVHDLAHVTAGVIATPGLDARRAQWSPDGTQLAFVGRPVVGGAPAGLANVYTMLANGTGVAQVTNITAGRGVGCVDWQ
jgi:Tol biopolymer transport system component